MRLPRIAGFVALITLTMTMFRAGSVFAIDRGQLKPSPEYRLTGAKWTLTLQSDKDDFIGRGKTYRYTDADALSSFVNFNGVGNVGGLLPGPPNHMDISMFQGKGSKANDDWFLTIASDQFGKPLSVGVFNPATRAAFALENTAGLDFSMNGSGCNTLTGRFTISTLVLDCTTDGIGNTVTHLKQLIMNFEQHCDGAKPALRGQFSLLDTTGFACDSAGSGDGSGGTPTPTPQPTPSTPVVILSDDLRSAPIVMGNAASMTVLFSTFIPDTTTGDVALSASSDADNLLVSVTPSVISARGTIDGVATIRTTPTTFAGDHAVTITATAPDGSTSSGTIFVTVICDPPFILGIDQPKGTTVSSGRPANLTVKASGSGPLAYQWFTGSTGLVNFPLASGSSPNFTTSALNDTTSYWVRVTNPCGSVDSQTVTVNVGPGAKPASNPRR
jgi:hypothetical protein